jgi:heptaprenylglyceryl phosphate synthase
MKLVREKRDRPEAAVGAATAAADTVVAGKVASEEATKRSKE